MSPSIIFHRREDFKCLKDRPQPQMTANIATNNKLIELAHFLGINLRRRAEGASHAPPFARGFPFALALRFWCTTKKCFKKNH